MKHAPNIAKGLILIIVVFGAIWGMDRLFDWTEAQGPGMALPVKLAVLAANAMMVATPFLPALQISMAFMILQGPEQVWWIFAASAAGFFFPFMLGTLISGRHLAKIFHDVGLEKTAQLIHRVDTLDRSERLSLIMELAPPKLKPILTRWRYVAIAVSLNTPGNVIIGGAGGILMVAGLSRLFHPAAILFTIVLCLLPVPIGVQVFGIDVLDWFRP